MIMSASLRARLKTDAVACECYGIRMHKARRFISRLFNQAESGLGTHRT